MERSVHLAKQMWSNLSTETKGILVGPLKLGADTALPARLAKHQYLLLLCFRPGYSSIAPQEFTLSSFKMPGATYSLNDAICRFSEVGTSSSRTDCDEYARQNCGGEGKPNYHQGIRSYIVIAGPSSNKIVQFREKTALLDMRSLAPAKEIHSDFVSSCSELGWIGEIKGQQLAIYEVDRLPGENYITASMSFNSEQHMRIVISLVRFVEYETTCFLCFSWCR